MREQLQKIKEEAVAAISSAQADIEALRVKYLGKKGELTSVLRQMGSLSAEERPAIGQLANEIRGQIEQLIEKKAAEMRGAEMERPVKIRDASVFFRVEERTRVIVGKSVRAGRREARQRLIGVYEITFSEIRDMRVVYIGIWIAPRAAQVFRAAVSVVKIRGKRGFERGAEIAVKVARGGSLMLEAHISAAIYGQRIARIPLRRVAARKEHADHVILKDRALQIPEKRKNVLRRLFPPRL